MPEMMTEKKPALLVVDDIAANIDSVEGCTKQGACKQGAGNNLYGGRTVSFFGMTKPENSNQHEEYKSGEPQIGYAENNIGN